jgi:hypothetical protein
MNPKIREGRDQEQRGADPRAARGVGAGGRAGVGRWITPSNEPIITGILDARDPDGQAVMDVFEAQLVMLASERSGPQHRSRYA